MYFVIRNSKNKKKKYYWLKKKYCHKSIVKFHTLPTNKNLSAIFLRKNFQEIVAHKNYNLQNKIIIIVSVV